MATFRNLEFPILAYFVAVASSDLKNEKKEIIILQE